MKKFVTTLWCAALAAAGYFITSETHTTDVPQNVMVAATIPNWNNNGRLPLDIVLDQAKTITNKVDTVEIHDTVLVDNSKYVRVPAHENTTDTLYMPLYVPTPIDGVPVNNKSPGTKKSAVTLTVDGNIVYSTDGLQEP